MKRCFAIVVLSVFLITYLLPVTTLVKADVVIGDNNESYVNENAYILGRKIALMESIPDLLNDGVTELSIENVNDLDEYLDYMWGELGDAVDYLTSGDWVDEVPTAFRNEALENITNYLNYVDNRSNIFAELLNNPTTTLLKTYVVGNNLPKVEYKPNYITRHAFNSLSRLNNGPQPIQPDIDFAFVNICGTHNIGNANDFYNLDSMPIFIGNNQYNFASNNYCIITPVNSTNLISNYITTGNYTNPFFTTVPNIKINKQPNGENYSVTYENLNYYSCLNGFSGFYSMFPNLNTSPYRFQFYNGNNNYNQINNTNFPTTFTGLSSAINFCYQHYRGCNIFVDGVQWVSYGEITNNNPTLNIDGYLTVYGNDIPPTYDIERGTQIDYDLLYDTIYNAIINALPIDQQDITYYDSHDTVYSPTIINNYGSDPNGESDWIESILDYAVVPDFRTSLLAPIETPLVNGLSVMVTVQDTIPQEILYVLGAVFVLLLFVCIINKMTK